MKHLMAERLTTADLDGQSAPGGGICNVCRHLPGAIEGIVSPPAGGKETRYRLCRECQPTIRSIIARVGLEGLRRLVTRSHLRLWQPPPDKNQDGCEPRETTP